MWLALPGALAAQAADTVRGRVTLPDGKPAAGARVTVTPLESMATAMATADSAGAYEAVVVGSDQYLVYGALPGYAPARTRVSRPEGSNPEGSNVVVADLRLAPVASESASIQLPPVVVVAGGRARVERWEKDQDDEQSSMDAPAFVAPGEAGDLSALARMTPGVSPVAGGFSVFGLSPDQNSVTLHGAPIPLTMLPPGAVRGAFSAMPFGVGRGGFSGGQLRLTPESASQIYYNTLSATLDLPALQWTDRTSARLGQRYTNVAIDGRHAGPLLFGKSTYAVSYRLSRRLSDLSTLVSADRPALDRAGVAPDSVARFLGLLGGIGVPAMSGAVPRHQSSDGASVMASVQRWPSSGYSAGLFALGSWSRTRGMELGPTVVPAAGSGMSSWNGVLQGRLSFHTGSVLQEATATLSGSASRSGAYLDLPGGTVAVASDAGDLSLLRFGGAPGASSSDSWSGDLRHSMSWNSMNRAHRYEMTTSLRFERYASHSEHDRLGSFAFLSLADLEASRPASYTRTLGSMSPSGDALSGAISLGDSWRLTDRFRVQYGGRADFLRFGARPAHNPAVDSVFGVRTDRVPGGIWPSPRVGFTWMAPKGGLGKLLQVVHGGTGLFVGTFPATLLGTAMQTTGLPSGVRRLLCVGDAVPAPDWRAYAGDPSRIPTTCADGGAPELFTDTVPRVDLFAPDYSPTRSWRTSLGWSTSKLHGYVVSVQGVYSRSAAQRGAVDLNFAGMPRFTLDDEGGRPVFVSPSNLVPETGVAALGEARRAPRYAEVLEQRSDLRSRAQQYTVSLSKPFSVHYSGGLSHSPSRFAWALTYLHGHVRDEARGTDGTTAGDPNDVEWGRPSAEMRHGIDAYLMGQLGRSYRVTLFGQLRSGTSFTPMVRGDVNGDGRFNDRAFVFDPATAADPAVAAGMATLLRSAPARVRECLSRQLGRVAGRGSCTGPWTASLNAQVEVDLRRFALPRESRATLSFVNLLGGIDQLFHGDDVRGWGQAAYPDPTLLSVNGFDPVTNRFRYDVNQRFGDTRPSRSVYRSPFQVTLQVQMPVGPDPERQRFRQAISRVEDGRRVRLSIDEIRAQLARSGGGLGYSIIGLRDSVLLTNEQITELRAIEQEHGKVLDTLWRPAAEYFANLPEPFDERVAYARFRAVQRTQLAAIRRYVIRTREVLTDYQVELLPDELRGFLDPSSLQSIDQ